MFPYGDAFNAYITDCVYKAILGKAVIYVEALYLHWFEPVDLFKMEVDEKSLHLSWRAEICIFTHVHLWTKINLAIKFAFWTIEFIMEQLWW